MLIALCCIVLMFLLFVVSIIEIAKCYKYKQIIASQNEQIESLNNQKDYYKEQLNQNNNENDKIFEEE